MVMRFECRQVEPEKEQDSPQCVHNSRQSNQSLCGLDYGIHQWSYVVLNVYPFYPFKEYDFNSGQIYIHLW